MTFVMPPPVSKRGNKRCFCPSVCPSVRRSRYTHQITTESKGLACPNSERRFPTFDTTCIPVSRSRSLGPLMLTHIVRHIFRTARSMHLIYGIDGGRRPASATGAVTSKVKGQGRKVTWSVWAVLFQCCTCVIRGRQGRWSCSSADGSIRWTKTSDKQSHEAWVNGSDSRTTLCPISLPPFPLSAPLAQAG